MPGYSGTPLPKKLGIKPGFRVYFVNEPPEVLQELGSELAACKIARNLKNEIDFAMLFTKSGAELTREFTRMAKALAPAGMLWVSWPKKSSGVATDLDENIVRDIGLTSRLGRRESVRGNGGLVRIKVCTPGQRSEEMKPRIRQSATG